MGQHITVEQSPRQLVNLYSGKQIVALGSLAAPQSSVFVSLLISHEACTINITPSQVIIQVEKVLVPGFIVSLYHEILNTLSQELNPFHLLVSHSTLQTCIAKQPMLSPKNASSKIEFIFEHLFYSDWDVYNNELSAISNDSISDSDLG